MPRVHDVVDIWFPSRFPQTLPPPRRAAEDPSRAPLLLQIIEVNQQA